MMAQLFAVVAPVLFCAGLGFGWAKTGAPYPTDFVTRAVMNIGAPCLIVFTMASVKVAPDTMWMMAKVAIISMACMAVVGVCLARLLALPIRSFMPPLVFSNSGNMGLPICLFAFGQSGLALALGYFVTMFVGHLSVGLVLADGAGGNWRAQCRSVLRQPVIHAMLFALAMMAFPLQLPLWLLNTVQLLSGLTIPLMLMTLGVSLASLRVKHWQIPMVFSVARIAGGLCVGWLVCELLVLEGLIRGVVLLQSAMPVAVFNYLFALKYQRNPQEVAALVLVSTALAFIALPVLVGMLLSE